MNPWDREEFDMMMEGPPVEEEQLGPPEEEQLGLPEAVQVEEPTSPVQEPTASATATPAAAPVVAVVLLSRKSPAPRPSGLGQWSLPPRRLRSAWPSVIVHLVWACQCFFGSSAFTTDASLHGILVIDLTDQIHVVLETQS